MNPSKSSTLSRPSHNAATGIFIAVACFAVLLVGFWLAAQVFGVSASIEHFPSAFASFVLLLAPYWFFGFGLAETLRERLRSHTARVVAPGALVLPYLLYAAPRGELSFAYTAIFLLLPIAIAALMEFAPSDDALSWSDIVALAAVGVPVEFGVLRGAWPHSGLGSMPKLLLMDAALYAFLVVRGAADVGYDFRPRWRDLAVGLREWSLFAPLAIVIGTIIHFIHFRGFAARPSQVAAGWMVTFFFVAIPEELFFRGLLQNLLEKRFAKNRKIDQASATGDATNCNATRAAKYKALFITAPIFGLSHFNKPLPFNWRYVLLATIAGIFYGRAWRDRKRLFCSGITHATVDVVWSAWFR